MRRWEDMQGCKPVPMTAGPMTAGPMTASPRTATKAVRALLRVAALILLAAAPAVAQETTVIIVRHAEQGGAPQSDPPLTEAGIQRAEALRDALARAGVTAIITSDRARTQLTARPLAELLHLDVDVAPVTRAGAAPHIADVVERIRAQAGGTVLVVGHSNTIGEIVEALGGGDVEPVPETVFDNFFVVRIAPDGTARFIRSRYGTPTAPSAGHAH